MDVDELMAEMGWVRGLARGLLGDRAAAEDVAQDAYLVASERAPDDGRPLRPWLHRVVLNLVRMRGRSGARRRARELATDDTQSVPTADQLLERIETQRVLAEEVIRLAEPYRSTVVLHYVEGLSSADIARRLGIPSATVRQRLKHALDQLRARLRSRDDGPVRGWLAALVPFTRIDARLAMGALAMKKVIAIVLVVVALLLLGGVGFHYLRDRGGSDDNAAVTAGNAHATRTASDPLIAKIAGRSVQLPAWFAQDGAPARHVAGVVLADGKPVAGATVRLGVNPSAPRSQIPAMSPGPPFVQVMEATTGAAGTFDFGVLLPVHLAVSAEAPGLAPVSIAVALADPREAPPPDQLVLLLGTCRSRVLGTVRDSANTIAHARLKVAGLAMVESDAKGAFAVCMPPAKFPNVRVEADGYGTINVQVPAMYGDFRRDFILVPEATISGIVVDEAGAPVPGAAVSARPALSDAQDEASGVDTVTDDAGRFQLTGLAPTRYGLGAISGTGTTVEHPSVVAIAGAATREIRLVIVRRTRLSGHVMMAGTPVAGARVTVDPSPFSPRYSTHYASTQDDGSFVLDNLDTGTFALDVFPYEVVSPKKLVIAGTDMRDVTIEVAAKATVRGRVTRHGVPIALAQVECNPGDAVTATRADGTYVLDALGVGRFRMSAQNLKAFTERPVTLVAGDQTIDLELDGGGEVQGTVVDERGEPVPSVLVRLDSLDENDSCSSLTDANGRFECATLTGHRDYQPRVYPSVVQHDRWYKPASGDALPLIRVENGDTIVHDVRLAIRREQLAIRGRVVDNTGATIADARVTIANSNEWGDPSRTRADEGGGFILDGLAPGTYTLRARSPDGSVGEARDVPAGATGVEIKLVRPGSITGTLTGFTGAVFVLASIELREENDVHEAKVDGDRFTISGLKPGNYTVQALVAGIQLDGTAVEVASGATATVALRARPRVTLDGRVVDLATGTPIAGMACRGSLVLGGREGAWIGTSLRSQLTDASGQFSIDVPVGRDRVTCMDHSGEWSLAAGDFEVAASATAPVEVKGVKLVLPASDIGFGVHRTVIPATVSAIIPAAKTGLAVGDVIVSIDGIATAYLSPIAVMTLAANHRSGSTIALQIVRGGQPLALRLAVP